MICASAEYVIDEETREQFARLLPQLQRQMAHRFRQLNPELCEDRTAEAVGLAFEMFVRLAERGKTDLAYVTPLAQYACRQVMDGRQCGGSLNRNDITSRHCQLKTGVRGRSIDRQNLQTGHWQEMVVEDRRASPAEVAATRIDFREWLQTLTQRQRQVVETLANGETTQAVAQRFQLSAGRISQLRRELMSAWNDFQGLVPEAA